MISWLSKKFSSPGRSRSKKEKDGNGGKLGSSKKKERGGEERRGGQLKGANGDFATIESDQKLLQSFRRQTVTSSKPEKGKKDRDHVVDQEVADEPFAIRSRISTPNDTPNRSRSSTPNSASHKLGSIFFKRPLDATGRPRRGSNSTIGIDEGSGGLEDDEDSYSMNDSLPNPMIEFEADIQSDPSSLASILKHATDTKIYTSLGSAVDSKNQEVYKSIDKSINGYGTLQSENGYSSVNLNPQDHEEGKDGDQEEKKDGDEGYNTKSNDKIKSTSNPLNCKSFGSSKSSEVSKVFGETDNAKKTSRNALLGQYVLSSTSKDGIGPSNPLVNRRRAASAASSSNNGSKDGINEMKEHGISLPETADDDEVFDKSSSRSQLNNKTITKPTCQSIKILTPTKTGDPIDTTTPRPGQVNNIEKEYFVSVSTPRVERVDNKLSVCKPSQDPEIVPFGVKVPVMSLQSQDLEIYVGSHVHNLPLPGTGSSSSGRSYYHLKTYNQNKEIQEPDKCPEFYSPRPSLLIRPGVEVQSIMSVAERSPTNQTIKSKGSTEFTKKESFKSDAQTEHYNLVMHEFKGRLSVSGDSLVTGSFAMPEIKLDSTGRRLSNKSSFSASPRTSVRMTADHVSPMRATQPKPPKTSKDTSSTVYNNSLTSLNKKAVESQSRAIPNVGSASDFEDILLSQTAVTAIVTVPTPTAGAVGVAGAAGPVSLHPSSSTVNKNVEAVSSASKASKKSSSRGSESVSPQKAQLRSKQEQQSERSPESTRQQSNRSSQPKLTGSTSTSSQSYTHEKNSNDHADGIEEEEEEDDEEKEIEEKAQAEEQENLAADRVKAQANPLKNKFGMGKRVNISSSNQSKSTSTSKEKDEASKARSKLLGVYSTGVHKQVGGRGQGLLNRTSPKDADHAAASKAKLSPSINGTYPQVPSTSASVTSNFNALKETKGAKASSTSSPLRMSNNTSPYTSPVTIDGSHRSQQPHGQSPQSNRSVGTTERSDAAIKIALAKWKPVVCTQQREAEARLAAKILVRAKKWYANGIPGSLEKAQILLEEDRVDKYHAYIKNQREQRTKMSAYHHNIRPSIDIDIRPSVEGSTSGSLNDLHIIDNYYGQASSLQQGNQDSSQKALSNTSSGPRTEPTQTSTTVNKTSSASKQHKSRESSPNIALTHTSGHMGNHHSPHYSHHSVSPHEKRAPPSAHKTSREASVTGSLSKSSGHRRPSVSETGSRNSRSGSVGLSSRGEKHSSTLESPYKEVQSSVPHTEKQEFNHAVENADEQKDDREEESQKTLAADRVKAMQNPLKQLQSLAAMAKPVKMSATLDENQKARSNLLGVYAMKQNSLIIQGGPGRGGLGGRGVGNKSAMERAAAAVKVDQTRGRAPNSGTIFAAKNDVDNGLAISSSSSGSQEVENKGSNNTSSSNESDLADGTSTYRTHHKSKNRTSSSTTTRSSSSAAPKKVGV